MFLWYRFLHCPKIMKTRLSKLSCLLVKNTNKGKGLSGWLVFKIVNYDFPLLLGQKHLTRKV